MVRTGWWEAGRALLRDRQAGLFASLVVVVYLACALPVLPTSRLAWFCDDASYAILAAAAAWILAPPRHRVIGPEERRFWWLLSVNFMIWALVDLIELADPSSKQWGPTGLVTDLLFIPSYMCLLWALEEQPHHRAGWSRRRRLLGLERFATMAFVLAIVGYFVLLPHLFRSPADPPLTHTFGCFAALDLLLAIRFLIRAILLGKTLWGAVYTLLMLTPLMWAVTDLATLNSLSRDRWLVEGPVWNLVWFGAFLPIIWAARLRFAPARLGFAGMRRDDSRHPIPSSVTTYAIAAPLAHIGASLAGLVPMAASQPYLVWCLVMTVLLGLLAIVHQQQLHRQAVQLSHDLERATEDLLRAKKLEAVGRLAGGIAHEFNNLLQVILGHCDLLLKRDTTEGLDRESALSIQAAGEHAASLTSQLLSFSRRQVLQPRVVLLNEVVIRTQQMLASMIGQQIALNMRLDPGVGRVRVDPVQLQQVLINLVINARDAMPAGGKLLIETSSTVLEETAIDPAVRVPSGSYVLLAVTDTGLGMDAATRAHAFDPFFSTKGTGQGVGLGLASVYGVVKQSGGYVFVESEPMQGTQVRVLLPAVGKPSLLPA